MGSLLLFPVSAMTLHRLLVLRAERVMDPSSEQPCSTQPSTRGCYTGVPSSVFFFLLCMSSPFCAPKTQLSIFLKTFQSFMLLLHNFFLLSFSRLLGMENGWEKAYTSYPWLLPGSEKEMTGSLFPCCHHLLRRWERLCHCIHTAAGEDMCWDDQGIFLPSPDPSEVGHKGPKGYRDYGTFHCQSSQSILLPQLLPLIMTLSYSPVVNTSPQATGAHQPWLTEAAVIKTTCN